MRKAICIHGGWDGHTPKESTDIFVAELGDAGFHVEVQEFGDAYGDAQELKDADLVVQCVTMSEIGKEQWGNLDAAVQAGTGFAGWHGGIIDSFRNNTDYQWMTGGQWVAHPGNCIDGYEVKTKGAHPVVDGIAGFRLTGTEQYYVHVDPGVEVLAETVFEGVHGNAALYPAGVVMPYAWTRSWGKGRVFVACWGHTFEDFKVPEAKEIVRRGLIWAAR